MTLQPTVVSGGHICFLHTCRWMFEISVLHGFCMTLNEDQTETVVTAKLKSTNAAQSTIMLGMRNETLPFSDISVP